MTKSVICSTRYNKWRLQFEGFERIGIIDYLSNELHPGTAVVFKHLLMPNYREAKGLVFLEEQYDEMAVNAFLRSGVSGAALAGC